MSSTTAISVSVSLETSNAIKALLDNSRFVEKIKREGLAIRDQSQLLRLALALVVTSDTTQIKKSIIHSNSDGALLNLLRKHTELAE